MADWPEINRLAWLRLSCCADDHPTRVEDVLGDDVVVSAPSTPHMELVHPPSDKVTFALGWAMGRGSVDQPVTLVSYAETPVPVWRLQRAGQPTEIQRRNYVRLEVAFNVEVQFLESGPPTIARVADISEGGIRGHVDKWAIDPGRRHFTLKLPIDDKNFYIRSHVVWWGNFDETGYRPIGVKFLDVDASTADDIRSYIFATQLERRRRGVD